MELTMTNKEEGLQKQNEALAVALKNLLAQVEMLAMDSEDVVQCEARILLENRIPKFIIGEDDENGLWFWSSEQRRFVAMEDWEMEQNPKGDFKIALMKKRGLNVRWASMNDLKVLGVD